MTKIISVKDHGRFLEILFDLTHGKVEPRERRNIRKMFIIINKLHLH